MWSQCGALRSLALARSRGARPCSGDGGVSYTQGQRPEPQTREYFYYVDHQGQVGGGKAVARGAGPGEVPVGGAGGEGFCGRGSCQRGGAEGKSHVGGRGRGVGDLDSAELEERALERRELGRSG